MIQDKLHDHTRGNSDVSTAPESLQSHSFKNILVLKLVVFSTLLNLFAFLINNFYLNYDQY